MKSFRNLLPHVALLLAQKAASQAGSSLLDACDELSVDHNDGVLSGRCRGTGDAVLTSVDLDQCLGWGSQAAHLGRRGLTPGLAPVRDGTFTEYCSPCYIVDKDERNQKVAHLLCNCGPVGSVISTEYSFDLESLVTVTNDGCLECMGVTSGCVRVAPSWTGPDASTDSDLGEESVDWPMSEGKRVPCEDSITDPNLESLLPTTYPNTTHHRCRQDNALCCYQVPARISRFNTYFEAFSLIEGVNHTWRLHYVMDKTSLEITGQLSRVVQFCTPGRMEQCEGETQPDEVPDLPDDDTGENYREDSEHIVYDDDDDSEHEWEPTHVAYAWASTTMEKSDWATSLPNLPSQ